MIVCEEDLLSLDRAIAIARLPPTMRICNETVFGSDAPSTRSSSSSRHSMPEEMIGSVEQSREEKSGREEDAHSEYVEDEQHQERRRQLVDQIQEMRRKLRVLEDRRHRYISKGSDNATAKHKRSPMP